MTVERPQVDVAFAADDVVEELPVEIGQRSRNVLRAALLCALVVIAYFPSFRGQFILNDEPNIVAYFSLRTWPDALRAIWLHPLQMPAFGPLAHTGFLLETRLFSGARPAGFHAVSILLHAMNTVLLWTLLRRLSLLGSFAAAAIFAVHPINVPDVAWIGQQPVLLCAMFYLASLLAYLRFTGITPAGRNDLTSESFVRGRTIHYMLSIALYLGALLSHRAGVTLPLAALVLIWWARPGVVRGDFVRILPFFALAIATRAILMAGHLNTDGIGTMWLVTGPAAWTSALALIFPFGRFALPGWSVGGGNSVGWLLISTIGLFAALACVWHARARLGRSPLATISLFVIALLPGLVQQDAGEYAIVDNHVAYLANSVLIAALVSGIALLMSGRSAHPAVVPAGGAIIVMGLGALTFYRVPSYRTDESLWSSVLSRDPTSVVALNRLGVIELRAKANVTGAVDFFTRALVVDRDNVTAQLHLAEAYARQGDADKARMQYFQVLAKHPDNADAHFGLGAAFNAQGNSTRALSELERALELRPNDSRTQLFIGRTHEFQGRNAEAERWYRTSIASDPRQTDAYVQLALLRFYNYGDKDDAERLLLKARQINPRSFEVFLNAGVMQFEIAKRAPLAENKKQLFEEAAMFLGQAALLDPRSALAFKQRGAALGARAQYTEARQERISYLNQAIEAFDRAAELGDADAGEFAAIARRERSMLESSSR